MANPVADKLAVTTDPLVEGWQNDAAGNDTNLPQNNDTPQALSPTGLAAELRSIKSEVRDFTVDINGSGPGWINYHGLDSIGTITITVLSTTTCTMTGNWTTRAAVGRRVRFHFTDGSTSTTVVSATTTHDTVNNVSTITVLDAVLTLGVYYAEWGAEGSHTDGTGADPLKLAIVDGAVVVPTASGGTGGPSGLTGDVNAADAGYPAAKVVGLQGKSISSTTPSEETTQTDQVLAWTAGANGPWTPQRLLSLLRLGANGNSSVGPTAIEQDESSYKGTILLPAIIGSSISQVKVNWVVTPLVIVGVDPDAIDSDLTYGTEAEIMYSEHNPIPAADLAWATPFESQTFFVHIEMFGFVNEAIGDQTQLGDYLLFPQHSFHWRDSELRSPDRDNTKATIRWVQTAVLGANSDDGDHFELNLQYANGRERRKGRLLIIGVGI